MRPNRVAAADLPEVVGALAHPDALRELLDGLTDGVYLVDRFRTILFWNRGSERISGYPASEVLGRRCFDNILRHVDAGGTRLCFGLCPLAYTMRDGVPRQADVWLHHRDGHRVPVAVRTAVIRDEEHKVIGAMEFFTDSTQMTETEQRLSELQDLALSDPLTRLANRRYLEVALGSRLAEVRRHARTLGVVFADVDHFKSVNDTYGHDVGDRVLQMVASTLARNIRTVDLAARFGGEEFVLLLPDADPAHLREVCDRLGILVRASGLDLEDGSEVGVTISLGATLAAADDTPRAVLHRADQLLYRSKRDGRDRSTIDVVVANRHRQAAD